MRLIRPVRLTVFAWFLIALNVRAADVPTPEAHLGFRPGADFHLAEWKTVVDYFHKVDEASDRVVLRELGSTTEGRPYIMAIVSSPETCKNLALYQRLQHRLADPRIKADEGDRADLVNDSKPVVLITCSIHSTETASTLMAMELLHGLATANDAATKEILERTILLLVPSANPDGVDKVARWYERSKGHPWEGSGMPELYHKYAGHDTNRDWFMLNLKETQLLTRMLYTEWWPTVSYDVHQMGSRGARLFVPPFYDPINPNLDPRINQWITLIGAHMAADLADAGKRGVLTHAMYDNWWNGGNRTTPQRHNIVAVLTEAASVRMASPIFLEKDDLRAATRGFSSHQPAINFVDPWPGGWWRLRDVVEYELIAARSLLTLAARYRTTLQANDQAMAAEAIRRGRTEPPFAWVVPADQRDPGSAARMVRILHETGVEVHRAETPFQAAGQTFAAKSWILPAAQPYRAHLKDMMERQVYPNRLNAKGEPEPPYDVSGWTLPLQMGVQAVAIAEEFPLTTRPLERVDAPQGGLSGSQRAEYYVLDNRANDDFIVLQRLLAAGVECQAMSAEITSEDGERSIPAGAVIFNANARSKQVLDDVLPTVSSRVRGAGKKHARPGTRPQVVYDLHAPSIAVYQSWNPSMDEGWCRLVLEQFQVPYTTVHNAEIRAGELKKRFNAILVPSIDAKTLREGYTTDQTEPAFVGGLGPEETEALRAFVEAGGTLVCLENACNYAIEAFGLPVRNVLKDVPNSEFYAPGSIVRVHVEATPSASPVVLGVNEELAAYFDRSLAFEIEPRRRATSLVRYARNDVLMSGWLLGAEKIQGKSAIVEAPRGQGRVILFGFPPQHRGQTHGTFRLLFNALLRAGMTPGNLDLGGAG